MSLRRRRRLGAVTAQVRTSHWRHRPDDTVAQQATVVQTQASSRTRRRPGVSLLLHRRRHTDVVALTSPQPKRCLVALMPSLLSVDSVV